MFEPYWSNVDWKAVGAFFVFGSGVASPYIRDWLRYRADSTKSRAQTAETTAMRLERLANENYARIEAQRDHLQAKLDAAQAAIELAQMEARAIEEWAHWFRHGWCETLQRHMNLAAFFDRLTRDELTPEVARVIAQQALDHMPMRPRPVPSIREAGETPPPT